MSHVPQARLIEHVMPLLEARRNSFRKTRQVHARAAVDGEQIVSVTSNGIETTNVAKAGDMVVRNLTEAGEMYIISAKSFPGLYEFADESGDGWAVYDPKGRILALEVDEQLTAELGVSPDFVIEAPWGSDERVCVGDYLVAPLPALDKIYRIARAEFEQTYSPAATD